MLTKMEALLESHRIWQDMADNDFSSKFRVVNSAKYLNGCPCCHYMYEQEGSDGYGADCDKYCPMYNYWCLKENNQRPAFLCECAGSVYQQWLENKTAPNAQKVADRIADAIADWGDWDD